MFIFKLATNLGDYWFIREAGVCNKFYNKIQILFPSLINYSQLLKEVNEMSPKHAPKTSMQTIQSSIFLPSFISIEQNKYWLAETLYYFLFTLSQSKYNNDSSFFWACPFVGILILRKVYIFIWNSLLQI